MIPKTIHYCWYGRGKFTPEIDRCIASWHKYCPDWEIKEWNEDNSPMDITWIKEAYKHRKYAFVADYMRFYALYHEGGVYMDTDMLLIKSIEPLLNSVCFIGREEARVVSMGIIGAEKNFNFLNECLKRYDSISFDLVSPPIITFFITPLLIKYGFIEKDTTLFLTNGMVVYQSDWFYPIPYTEKYKLNDLYKYVTENTIGVHLWNYSWQDEFRLFREGKYWKGFCFAIKRIIRNPFLPFRYYRKLIRYLIRWKV